MLLKILVWASFWPSLAGAQSAEAYPVLRGFIQINHDWSEGSLRFARLRKKASDWSDQLQEFVVLDRVNGLFYLSYRCWNHLGSLRPHAMVSFYANPKKLERPYKVEVSLKVQENEMTMRELFRSSYDFFMRITGEVSARYEDLCSHKFLDARKRWSLLELSQSVSLPHPADIEISKTRFKIEWPSRTEKK